MVFTEAVLAIAHVNEEKLLDVIPLADVMSIQDMGGIATADAEDGAGRILLDIAVTDRSLDNFFSKLVPTTQRSTAEERETYRQIFDSIDVDKTGSCSREEMSTFLKKLFYTREEIDEFINMADADHSGEVTFEEFWSLRMKTGQSRRGRDLKITVVKAENILNAGKDQSDFILFHILRYRADGVGTTQQSTNFWDCSDPYVEVICGKNSQKTRVVDNDLNPEFNECFEFSISPPDEVLVVKIWDYDAVKSDDLLGTLEIPLYKLKAGESYHQWSSFEYIH